MPFIAATNLASLLVLFASSAQALKHQIPTPMIAADRVADCPMPDHFHILDFRRNTTKTTDDHHESAFLSASFRFVDLDTGLDTMCVVDDAQTTRRGRRHRVAKTKEGARLPCEDENVEFILEEDSRLTMVEKACPGGSTMPMEAAGSIDILALKLNCVETGATETTRTSTERVLAGDFVSLGPPPPPPPSV
ncbi:hypothetical protein Micbo1qcDRAFT_200929 [Microdochium bolleyi]|uniref:AA1-like domain-containing protein n=1 Tax=Microdochium bolleyi TaxID=196109 RepID=A0A136JEI2_9PEZI|nr:hypothetical protein Micbo1qcDRAFT_200929 [Microdochium bolleyi]